MEWTLSREDPIDPHSLPEFSPLISGLLQPIPSVPNASDWPIPTLMRDTRADFRYDVSLSAGPEFDTDSANDDRDLRDDDDISSELHGAMSTSEDTSVVQDPVHLNPPPIVPTPPLSTHNVQTLLQSHLIPAVSPPPNPITTLPVLNTHSIPPLPHVSASIPVSVPPVSAATVHMSSLPGTTPLTLNTSLIKPEPSATPVAVPAEKHSSKGNNKGARSASIKPALDAETSISPVTSKISTESEISPRSPSKPTKSITKKVAKKATSSSSNGAPISVRTASISAGGSTRASGVLSHTKLCRDRLNNMFEKLKHTLPPAPPGVEVKHKAQVLDYAIFVLKNMVERTSQLEIELAVSSNKATMEWVSKLVNRTDDFAQAAEEVMRLFAKRRGWPHVELWAATDRQGLGDAKTKDSEHSVSLKLCRAFSEEPNEDSPLSLFSKESTGMLFQAGDGVPGRVWLSMRPEWVTGLSVVKNFKRADLARKHGVKACLAVPVTITGKIEGILCFYDVKHRPYDNHCLELAMRLAWALGNAIGGSRARCKALAQSGTLES